MPNNYVINLKNFVDCADEFAPNYQFEQPFEFNTLVNHYMTNYYDIEKEPERYLQKLAHAVRWANKSIMLDKLGLDSTMDLEMLNPELFKSTMLTLAKHYEDILIKGESISFNPTIEKSLNGDKTELNRIYEKIWKKTFDTIQVDYRI